MITTSRQNGINRRLFLKAGMASLALPTLESYSQTSDESNKAKTFVAIGTYLGWYKKAFYPTSAGANYEMPDTLKPIEAHRKDFTIFSGLDHKSAHGHHAWTNFLCGQKIKSYSLDQVIADKIGDTRFASIGVAAGAGEAASSMSFTKSGVPLPMIQRPSILYKKLFISKADRKMTEYMLRSGKSALDHVLEDANRLQKSVSKYDKAKLTEYFDSMRSVEKRMDKHLSTIHDPVPETDYRLPNYDPITPNLQMEAENLMYDLMVLAIENGSSNVLSMFIHGLGQVFTIDGKPLKSGYHGLTHHGNDPSMIGDLKKIESCHMQCFNNFLTQLKNKQDAQGKSLLDSTIVLLGTGMGDSSRHDNSNLPTLVAGGGFKHGQHIALNKDKKDEYLLGDLYISIQQKLGIETDSFSNANKNLNQVFA
ncbi:MAG: DUF1552 domain-containing protein [Lentisphaeraceae bacterium]|nr:DUF1552 domain-containing protein [Lentisphaeraceae bacterium]